MIKKTFKSTLLITLTSLSIGLLSACSSEETVKVTYHFFDKTTVKRVKVGEDFAPINPRTFTNYDFYQYFTDDTYKNEALKSYVATKDMDFYALYCSEGNKFVTYYDYDSNGNFSFYREEAKVGDPYTIKEDVFTKSGYYVVQYSKERFDQSKSFSPKEKVNVSEHLKLYAIWNKEYVGDYDGQSYRIRTYPGATGLGSAVILFGDEQKDGFYNQESGEFEFYFGSDDEYIFDEDIVGRITGEGTFVTCNLKEKGMYIYKDYLTGQETGALVLYLDGYGLGIIASFDGTGLQARNYGYYELTEYGDYLLKEIDAQTRVPTGKYIYFKFNQTNRNSEEVNGTFTVCGEEEGSYFYFDTTSVDTDFRLTLNGYGDALYQEEYNSSTGTYAKSILGTYKATEKYSSSSGEYIFTSIDNKVSFKFVVYAIEDNNGVVNYVYIPLNEKLEGTYHKEDTSYPSLYLDGYFGAIYYLNEVDYLIGNFMYQNNELICFFVDEANNESTMRFVIDLNNKTYYTNDNGFVIVENELIKYQGYSSVIEIPEGVTTIKEDAFNYLYLNADVVEVYIPASVTSIEARAFENAGALKYVHFLGNVPPTIDSTAFRWPGGSFRMIVPSSALDAYKSAPIFSSNYLNYIVSEEEFINRPLFEVEGDTLIRFNPKPGEDISSIKIPDEVKTIKERVFRYVEGLKNLDLNNVTEIKQDAFLGCYDLETLTAPNLKIVGDGAFIDCVSLNNVTLKEVEIIEANAFSGCLSLNKVTLGNKLKEIGNLAFSQCAIEIITNGEEEILYNHTLYLTLEGTIPPSMGSRVFYGTTIKIKVASIDVALNYYETGDNWGSYFNHFFIESGEEKGDYVDVENLLNVKFDGRMELYEFEVFFYKIEGNKVTYYYLDDGILYDIEGTYSKEEGFTIEGSKFVRKGTKLSYKNGSETLEIDSNYTRENYNYKYNAKFNGQDVVLTVTNTSITTAIGNTKYTFELKADMTFTYKTSVNVHTDEFTAQDGSRITITFSEKTFLIKGSLNSIIRSDGNPLSTTLGWYATKISENVYTFTTQFGDKDYSVTITLNGSSFSYTYEVYTRKTLKTSSNDIVTVSLDKDNNVAKLSITFRVNGELINTVSTFVKENDYYIVTIDFNEQVRDTATGQVTEIPSPRNGVYKVTLDFTNNSATITKIN